MRTTSSSFLSGILFGAVLGATALMLLSRQSREDWVEAAGDRISALWRRGRRGLREMYPEGAR